MTVINKLRYHLNGSKSPTQPVLTSDQDEVYVAELYRLGLHHLSRRKRVLLPNLTPVDLLLGLSRSAEPRVRAAVPVLLLMHPSYGQYLVATSERALQMGCTQPIFDAPVHWAVLIRGQAAAYLQQAETERLKSYPVVAERWCELPDVLSHRLSVPPVQDIRSGRMDVKSALACLNQVHVELAGTNQYHINYAYDQYLQHLYRSLEQPWQSLPDGTI